MIAAVLAPKQGVILSLKDSRRQISIQVCPNQPTDGRIVNRIVIKGAREHNLKNLSIDIPHRRFTVITGVSGSGKSSLAFDTLYAEGQRRYVESLSTYAKQFLERISRPDVDEVSGISPSIAIKQQNTARSARSTVGTATEIYDYLRLLYARVGRTFCPECGKEVVGFSPDEVIDDLISIYRGKEILVIAPVPVVNGQISEAAAKFLSEGYTRVYCGGELKRLDSPDDILLEASGCINLVLDRVKAASSNRSRLLESIENAYARARGRVVVSQLDMKENKIYTNQLKCSGCSREFEQPRPLLFSFNTPYGACPHCRGFGNRMEFEEKLIVPNPEKSLKEHAVEPWSSERMEPYHTKLISFCRSNKIPVNLPFYKLKPEAKSLILEGNKKFKGVIPFLEKMRAKSYKRYARFFTRKYLAFKECRYCRGGRLREEAYNVLIAGKNIRAAGAMTPDAALDFISSADFNQRENVIARDILLELKSRLKFLLDVGLYYMTLDRLTRTLSGGEAQRINLANSLGANLVDILYVLDEPSIGLHPSDTKKLVKVLLRLRDRGNTVVVVEHDPDIIIQADNIIDLGPGAGEKGGEVLYSGPLKRASASRSKTIKLLRKGTPLKRKRKPGAISGEYLELKGVSEHNLQKINVSFPLGALTVVTGVSGSGKSTLVCDVLYSALRTTGMPGYVRAFSNINGADKIEKVLMVDQSPIGKSARSNPITYIKGFSYLRDIFAAQKLSLKRGYGSGRFSFNVTGGRCSRCEGLGYEKVEMLFMADLFIACSECEGKRFNPQTLEISFKGRNLAQVLEMTVDEAKLLFQDYRPLSKRLEVLQKVGLGYIRLGQPSSTLSGGESQRIKIARELAESSSGGCLYILDEPTTGLHMLDVEVLIGVLGELVARGNTVIVIEHNPQVILQADYVIDLGPGGGDEGGRIVAAGAPETIMRAQGSRTGAFLRKLVKTEKKGTA